MTRYQPGDRLSELELQAIDGRTVRIPDGLVHLQFRRFAGCPVCDLHLRSIVRRHGELLERGIREVVVFHSTAQELRAFEAHQLPFPVIADPAKRLYAAFGVEARLRALLDPRVWWPIVRGVTASIWRVWRGEAPLRVPSVSGGNLGLPADFLIDDDGRILARKYGTHAYDQWSVDEILENVEVASNGLLNCARSKLTAAATAGRAAWRS